MQFQSSWSKIPPSLLILLSTINQPIEIFLTPCRSTFHLWEYRMVQFKLDGAELGQAVYIPTFGFHLWLKMSIIPDNIPRAICWRLSLLLRLTDGSLNHLPGWMVQCRGTYVPTPEQPIIFVFGRFYYSFNWTLSCP